MPWIDASEALEKIASAQERRSERYVFDYRYSDPKDHRDVRTPAESDLIVCSKCKQDFKFDGSHRVCSRCRYKERLTKIGKRVCKRCGKQLRGAALIRNYCRSCQNKKTKERTEKAQAHAR